MQLVYFFSGFFCTLALMGTRTEESRTSDKEAVEHRWIDPAWIIMDTDLRAERGCGDRRKTVISFVLRSAKKKNGFVKAKGQRFHAFIKQIAL